YPACLFGNTLILRTTNPCQPYRWSRYLATQRKQQPASSNKSKHDYRYSEITCTGVICLLHMVRRATITLQGCYMSSMPQFQPIWHSFKITLPHTPLKSKN